MSTDLKDSKYETMQIYQFSMKLGDNNYIMKCSEKTTETVVDWLLPKKLRLK